MTTASNHRAAQRPTRPARGALTLLAAPLTLASLVVGITACGDDDNNTKPLATTQATPVEQGTTPVDLDDTTPYGTESTEPIDEVLATDTGGVHSNPAGPVQIDVRVGTDSGPDRVELVAKGSEVQLNITNPGADDSFHIHGYDLEEDVPKGSTATFNFTAGLTGRFEVESHTTEAVLVVIEVK